MASPRTPVFARFPRTSFQPPPNMNFVPTGLRHLGDICQYHELLLTQLLRRWNFLSGQPPGLAERLCPHPRAFEHETSLMPRLPRRMVRVGIERGLAFPGRGRWIHKVSRWESRFVFGFTCKVTVTLGLEGSARRNWIREPGD